MRRHISIVVVLVIALAACSDDDAPSSTQAAATPTSGATVDSTTAPDDSEVAVTTAAPTTTAAPSTSNAVTTPPTTPPTTAGATVPGTTAADTADSGPYAPGAEWQVDSPDAHGIDTAGLDKARDYAFAAGKNTQGVVVVHRGAIVGEWYDTKHGAGQDSWAASWSMAKSFTSALIGIALAEGLIPSIDEPMAVYYPSWRGTPRESITLRDVLHMSSGLDFVEDYDPNSLESSDIIQMVVFEHNQLRYAVDRPAKNEPGSTWSYSSGDTMLLSGVLEKVTGMEVTEYAEEKVFEPLGIDQIDWWQDARSNTLTYCCVDTTSRDFARFGLLYLHEGMWGDQQVVPSEWVADSVTPAPSYEGYGYQWWLTGVTTSRLPQDTFSARGHDGQYIYVVPSLDLVVVRNGTYGKYDGPPIGKPTLFPKYPSGGLVPGEGTTPPDEWDDAKFLTPIINALPAQ
jgi:CubicO group peptidase (beta-lactamase class C family)